MTAAEWIALEIVGNNIKGFGPLPLSARDEMARFMVSDDRMGWPSIEAAQATLDEWKWTPREGDGMRRAVLDVLRASQRG